MREKNTVVRVSHNPISPTVLKPSINNPAKGIESVRSKNVFDRTNSPLALSCNSWRTEGQMEQETGDGKHY